MAFEMTGKESDGLGVSAESNTAQTDDVVPEMSSRQDQADLRAIQTFYGEDSPACCQKYKCNKIIPEHLAVTHRQKFLELNKEEQDLVITSHLQSQRHLKELEECYRSRTVRKSAQTSTNDECSKQLIKYRFAGLNICQKMYYFLYNLSEKRYRNIVKHYDNSGLSVRTYKLKNVASKRSNVLKQVDIEGVIQFIKSYADRYGSPLPGRFPGCKNLNAIKLPSHETKNAIYKSYCDSLEQSLELRLKPIAFSTFTELWRKHCPNVVISKPSSDLCNKGRLYQPAILSASNTSVIDEKMKANLNYQSHLNDAKEQRNYYNKWRHTSKTKKTLDEDTKEGFKNMQDVLNNLRKSGKELRKSSEERQKLNDKFVRNVAKGYIFTTVSSGIILLGLIFR